MAVSPDRTTLASCLWHAARILPWFTIDATRRYMGRYDNGLK